MFISFRPMLWHRSGKDGPGDSQVRRGRGGHWLHLRRVISGGLIPAVLLAAVLVAGCHEEQEPAVETFPDMAPLVPGKGGIRGHMHGDPTEVVFCSQEWDISELGHGIVMVSCPGSELTTSIDSSQNDLFFFDGLEPGDYWLMGKGYSAPNVPRWYMMEQHYRVTVEEGQWTDLPSFKLKGG